MTKTVFLHGTELSAQSNRLCSLAKAPFLSRKNTAFTLQERCFGEARTVLSQGQNGAFARLSIRLRFAASVLY